MDTLFAERMETVFNELTQYMELYSQPQYNEEYLSIHEQNAQCDVIEDAETIVCDDIFEVASDISDNDNNYVIYYNYDIYNNIYDNCEDYYNDYDNDYDNDYYDELDSVS